MVDFSSDLNTAATPLNSFNDIIKWSCLIQLIPHNRSVWTGLHLNLESLRQETPRLWEFTNPVHLVYWGGCGHFSLMTHSPRTFTLSLCCRLSSSSCGVWENTVMVIRLSLVSLWLTPRGGPLVRADLRPTTCTERRSCWPLEFTVFYSYHFFLPFFSDWMCFMDFIICWYFVAAVWMKSKFSTRGTKKVNLQS